MHLVEAHPLLTSLVFALALSMLATVLIFSVFHDRNAIWDIKISELTDDSIHYLAHRLSESEHDFLCKHVYQFRDGFVPNCGHLTVYQLLSNYWEGLE